MSGRSGRPPPPVLGEELMLLNAAICTILLMVPNYKSPLAGSYRGNL